MNARVRTSATALLWLLIAGIASIAACTVDFSARDDGQGWCGDGTRDGSEICDGEALDFATCEDLGFQGGSLACAADCGSYDSSACTEPCGDGIRQGTEVCDGTDFAGDDCAQRGYHGGALLCAEDCSAVDEAGCSGRCGDQVINGSEVCDGTDLGPTTCVTLGHHTGDLVCRPDCAGIDEAGCSGRCGDQVINGPEVCDGAALGGRLCSEFGYYGGTLGCQADCTALVFDACDTSPRIVLNEISLAAPDRVELLNLSEVAVDLEDWTLDWGAQMTATNNDQGQLVLPAYSLAAGARVVLADESGGGGEPPDVTPGHIQFHDNIAWGSLGGAALLSDDGGAPVDYARWGHDVLTHPAGVTWADTPAPLPAPGRNSQTVTLSRLPDGVDTDTAADFCVMEGTPQAVNAGTCLVILPPGTVLITEIDPQNDIIELYNPGPGSVDLGGWAIKYDTWTTEYRLLPTFVLTAGAYVVADDDAANPDAPYADGTGLHIGSMDINRSMGSLTIAEPHAFAGVDFVRWGAGSEPPLPPDAWAGGLAPSIPSDENLARSGTTDTDAPGDWCAQTPSLGVANSGCP